MAIGTFLLAYFGTRSKNVFKKKLAETTILLGEAVSAKSKSLEVSLTIKIDDSDELMVFAINTSHFAQKLADTNTKVAIAKCGDDENYILLKCTLIAI